MRFLKYRIVIFLITNFLFSYPIFAETISSGLHWVTKKQSQQIIDNYHSLNKEQKDKIRKKMLDEYNNLDDEKKSKIKSKLQSLPFNQSNLLRFSTQRLSINDQAKIELNILSKTEKKLLSLPKDKKMDLYKDLKGAKTSKERIHILSKSVGVLGDVTYGIEDKNPILQQLNDMTLDELSDLFLHISDVISNSEYADSLIGIELSQLFSGLSKEASQLDRVLNDGDEYYMPLFLRNPGGANCRTNDVVDGTNPTGFVEVHCITQDNTSAFLISRNGIIDDLITGHDQNLSHKGEKIYPKMVCDIEEGWNPSGSGCANEQIPGIEAWVEVDINFGTWDGGNPVIKPYVLENVDHLALDRMYAAEHNGDTYGYGTPITTSDPDNSSASGVWSGYQPVYVTFRWTITDMAAYSAYRLEHINDQMVFNNLHPFKILMGGSESDGLASAHVTRKNKAILKTEHHRPNKLKDYDPAVDMKQTGYPQGYIVANLPGIATTCSISQPEQTVDLGTYKVADIVNGPVESSSKPFEIAVECEGTEDYQPFITVIASGKTGVDNFNGQDVAYLLNNLEGDNAASNIGVAIYYNTDTDKSAVPNFNTSTLYPEKIKPGQMVDLKFLAKFYKPTTGDDMGTVTPGKFSSDITISANYP